MISSIFATAIARPTKIWARSRALLSRNLVRRATTCSRKATNTVKRVFRFTTRGRPARVERHHVGAEIGLQRREFVELVQDHLGHRVAIQFDDDAKTVAVGFV